MTELSVFDYGDGILVVDSRLIAERLGIEHESFMRTLKAYQTDIEQNFEVLRFEIGKPQGGSKGGRPPEYVLLTENRATFVMTLSRNTLQVIKCKAELVQSFSKAKEFLRQKQVPRGPYWYERMKTAMSDLDKPLHDGYFCVYLEMMNFFCQLETRLAYVVPDFDPKTGKFLVPDISIGRGFNEFLRSEEELPKLARKNLLGTILPIDFRGERSTKHGLMPSGSHYHQVKIYNHVYPETSHGKYKLQEANSYPDRYREIFHYYLREYWIVDRCIPYLKERDPQGIKHLVTTLNTMPPFSRRSLAFTLIGRLLHALPPAA